MGGLDSNALEREVDEERSSVSSRTIEQHLELTEPPGLWAIKTPINTAMAAYIIPYELYSDAAGFLLNKLEWEKANASHPETSSFGSIPKGWPSQFAGPQTWTGQHLEQHRKSPTYKTKTKGEC